MREGFRSSSTIATARSPQAIAMRAWAESTAGMLVAPGSVKPSASAMLVMVDAVPMVLQVPCERVMRPSSSIQSAWLMLPARSSSQYFLVWVPAPVRSPRHWPFNIGPAGKKIAGRSMLMAPIKRPGVVLSQPPINTTPSIGCERSSSSHSIARKLRYIMVLGLTITSPSESAGISIGCPPAATMPRLTDSARSRRCAWQGEMSLQVLMMPSTGLPMKSSRRSPVCCRRWRWPKLRKSLAANQRWLRSSEIGRVMADPLFDLHVGGTADARPFLDLGADEGTEGLRPGRRGF